MFLPLALREHVRAGDRAPARTGRTVPLVAGERTLFESTAPPPPDAPPSWLHWYLLLGAVIGALAAVLGGWRGAVAAGRLGLGRHGGAVGIVGADSQGSCWRGSGPSPITPWPTGTRISSR